VKQDGHGFTRIDTDESLSFVIRVHSRPSVAHKFFHRQRSKHRRQETAGATGKTMFAHRNRALLFPGGIVRQAAATTSSWSGLSVCHAGTRPGACLARPIALPANAKTARAFGCGSAALWGRCHAAADCHSALRGAPINCRKRVTNPGYPE